MKVLRLRVAKTLAVIMVVCLGGFVCLGWIKDRDGPSIEDRPFNEALAPQVAQRGAYLVQVGNCAACHTARGGFPFAGGKGIDTSFGTVFTSNITSDKLTGIGACLQPTSGKRCTMAAQKMAGFSIPPFLTRSTPESPETTRTRCLLIC